jgi:hypothetical protein
VQRQQQQQRRLVRVLPALSWLTPKQQLLHPQLRVVLVTGRETDALQDSTGAA